MKAAFLMMLKGLPHGKMPTQQNSEGFKLKVSWRSNKKLKPIVILERLKRSSIIDSEGRVSYNGFEKFELDSVLFSMIDFHKEYSHHTSRSFYSLALDFWIVSGSTTAEQFMQCMNKQVVEYGKKPELEYIAVTSISLIGGFPIERIKLSGSTVQCFPKGLPKKYRTRIAFDSRWKEMGSPMPEHYCPVVIRFKSKSAMDGMEFALAELDYVRGVFSLILNSSYKAPLGGGNGSRLPINSVMLGGMHTLHNQKGKLASGGVYWFESEYTEVDSLYINESKRAHAIDFFNQIHSRIYLHKDGHVLKEAIVRFVRAFDGKDKNFALQKIWAALETLMAPGENNTDLVVKRCSFMFGDRAYHHQVLEHLKDYRNRSVHTGRSIENPNDYCYQAQNFFRQAVIFHASNAEFFSSLRESNEFLDLSDSIQELERKKLLIEKAIIFLTPPNEAT
ncbi:MULTISPECIES: hypothetical protein [unclassified Pseudomonas]|uniref:hypothetical protein n=1 Tax=unclassified Pseudomonas TaxID=196821 RepID=UPI00128DFE83|nr:MULTISPECIES: hypothetical protein [unclassified Pseudomonas]MPQ68296.1 hypothetical protein [Pseudomonas sp. MWU12-2323]